MSDRELDFTVLRDYGAQAEPEDIRALIDAVDDASDQNQVTWLAVDGRRVAKIAPVDEVPGPGGEVYSASEFLRMSAEERRAAALGRFYGNLHSPVAEADGDGLDREPEPGKTEA